MSEIDIDNTDKLIELFKLPAGDRDAEWYIEFFRVVPTAALRVPEKEIMTGPDGFPYVLMFIPPADAEFRAFSVAAVLDVCIEKGVGIAIYPEQQGQPLWVFTYGNLLSYKLTGQFDARQSFTAPPPPTSAPRQMILSQPSEEFLPRHARGSIRRFLEMNGVKDPKIALLTDPAVFPPQQLAFDLRPDQFQSRELFEEICRRLTWYLPPSYVFRTLQQRDPKIEAAMAPL